MKKVNKQYHWSHFGRIEEIMHNLVQIDFIWSGISLISSLPTDIKGRNVWPSADKPDILILSSFELYQIFADFKGNKEN